MINLKNFFSNKNNAPKMPSLFDQGDNTHLEEVISLIGRVSQDSEDKESKDIPKRSNLKSDLTLIKANISLSSRMLKETANEVASIYSYLNSICQKIAQYLPLINNEIKKANQSSNLQFVLFVDNTLKNNLKKLQSLATEIVKYITEIQQKDGEMLRSFCNSLQAMSEISNSINEVSELSVEMELLSLNAIVLAAKAGKEGRAFGCGAENLNRIGFEIMEVADSIKLLDQNLQGYQGNLKKLIETNDCFFKNELANISGELDGFLTIFKSNINNVVFMLKDLMDRAENIGAPTKEIMNILQAQEMIGNKLMHIKTSLEVGEGEIGKMKDDEISEILLFIEEVSHHSIDLLDKLQDSIRDLINILKQKFMDIKEMTQKVSIDKEIISKFLTNNDQAIFFQPHLERFFTGGKNLLTLEDLFFDGNNILNKQLKAMETISDSNKQVIVNNREIVNKLNELSEDFLKIKKLAKKLLFIDVNIKIEVSSSVAMLRDSGFVNEMERLVEQSVNIRYNVSKQLLDLRMKLVYLIEDYSQILTKQLDKSFHKVEEIMEDQGEYNNLKKELEGLVVSLNTCSNQVLPLIDNSLADIEEFNNLLGRYQYLKQNLNKIVQTVKKIKEDSNLGLVRNRKIEIKNEQLKSIIDRFIQLESDSPQTSMHLGNIVGQTGTQETGDITLF
ncbi:MAG: hypothetical protein V1872_13785 [bacterium]